MSSDRETQRGLETGSLVLEISGDGAWEIPELGTNASLHPGIEIRYSPRFQEMLGYGAGESPEDSRIWLEAIHADDMARVLQAHRDRLARPGESTSVKYRVRTRQGEERWWREIGRVLPGDRPGIVRVMGVVRDITEAKRAEELLQRRCDMLEQTQAVARVGGWELHLETQKLYWTEETHVIHEVPPGFEPELATAIHFYAPEHVPLITAAVEGCMRGEPYDVALDLITYTGKRIHVHATGRPRVVDGKVVRVFGSFRDVTEETQREEALRSQLALIEEQQRAIRALSTPILQLWEGIITLPLIGTIDAERAAQIMDSVLAEVVRVGARYAILDLTGVAIVDMTTADHLVRITRAVALLGAEARLCGLTPPVAQALTDLGVDLTPFRTHRNLQEALRACLRDVTRSPRR
jgi:rsbT co-antagonist protein RsbR